MTAHPIDTEALRARLARAIKSGIDAYPIEEWDPRDEWEVAADEVLLIVRDLLAAAEHRATRAEAQSAIRGRAVAIHQQRAREAEARIKAVREALDGWDDIQPPAFHQLADEIRGALDGTDTPPDAG